MLKFVTYHRNVWFIDDEGILPVEPDKTFRSRMRRYILPSWKVALVHSKTEDKMLIYAGYQADKEHAMQYIIGLCNSLEVKSLELKDLEKIQDMRDWDKYITNMNKMLASWTA